MRNCSYGLLIRYVRKHGVEAAVALANKKSRVHFDLRVNLSPH